MKKKTKKKKEERDGKRKERKDEGNETYLYRVLSVCYQLRSFRVLHFLCNDHRRLFSFYKERKRFQENYL